MPDEQDKHGPKRCPNEAGALIQPVPSEMLAEIGRDESARNAQQSRQDET